MQSPRPDDHEESALLIAAAETNRENRVKSKGSEYSLHSETIDDNIEHNTPSATESPARTSMVQSSKQEKLDQATTDLSDIFKSSDTKKQTEEAQRIAILNFINAYKAVREEESRYLSCWASICFFFCFARSFSREEKLEAINDLSDALSSIGASGSDKIDRLRDDITGNDVSCAPLKQGRLGQSLLMTYLEEYLNRHCPSQEEGDSKKSPRPAEYSAGTPILMAGRNGGYGTTGSINEISPGLSANG